MQADVCRAVAGSDLSARDAKMQKWPEPGQPSEELTPQGFLDYKIMCLYYCRIYTFQTKMNTVVDLTKFCRHTKRVGFLNSEGVEGFIEVTFRLTIKERLTVQGLDEKESGYAVSGCEHCMRSGKVADSISLVPLYDLHVDGSGRGSRWVWGCWRWKYKSILRIGFKGPN